MTVKVSLHQAQHRLPELFVVQRNGKDCAVLVSARQWRRTLGAQLDALGPQYRLPAKKQKRAEQLLAAKQQRSLTAAEGRELKSLLRESVVIMLRRASALEHLA